jgi:hypothetical protein
MNDFAENGVDPVIGLETQSYGDEETLLWNNSVDHVFAGEWIIHRIHVQKPEYIGPLGTFSEN